MPTSPGRDVVLKHYEGGAVDYAPTIHVVLEDAYILDDGVSIFDGAIVAETVPASLKNNPDKYRHLPATGSNTMGTGW